MKTVVSVVALALFAGSASAMLEVSSTAVQGLPIGAYQTRVGPSVYAGMPGPYSAFTAATGLASNDDYVSSEAASFNLAQFRFVGGVQQAGGGITVEFFDTASSPINSFHTFLPSAGDFLWTITLGSPPDGGDSTFNIANAGFISITVDAANTGRWFFTSTAPTIGSNNVATGTGSGLVPARNNAFELVMVPAPASLALLGIGGLLAGRRRR